VVVVAVFGGGVNANKKCGEGRGQHAYNTETSKSELAIRAAHCI
jgi:hypothetical protein